MAHDRALFLPDATAVAGDGARASCGVLSMPYPGRWSRERVHDVLSNAIYTGNYRFNRVEARSPRLRPEAEWVTVRVEVIVNEGAFAR